MLEQAETRVPVISPFKLSLDKQASSAREKPTFEISDFAKTGLEYAARSNNPNLHNFGWVENYLSNQEKETLSSNPDFPKEGLRKTWQAVCDDASAKGISAIKWYRTAFENRIRDYRPEPQAAKSYSSAPEPGKKRYPNRVLKLMGEAAEIVNRLDPSMRFKTADLTVLNNSELYHNGRRLFESEFDPVVTL